MPHARSDCASGEACGLYEERTKGGSGKTGAIMPNVCGRPMAWMGAHTACGGKQAQGEQFPNTRPYECNLAARHGSYKQVTPA